MGTRHETAQHHGRSRPLHRHARPASSPAATIHGLVDHENAMPGGKEPYIRGGKRTDRTYPDLAEDLWVVQVPALQEAAVRQGCPSGAIAKDVQTGNVRIDKEA
jgi:hypothetical protein